MPERGTLLVEEDILRFDVAVDDGLVVEILYGQGDLAEVQFGPVFGKFPLLPEVETEISSQEKVRHHIHVVPVLEFHFTRGNKRGRTWKEYQRLTMKGCEIFWSRLNSRITFTATP